MSRPPATGGVGCYISRVPRSHKKNNKMRSSSLVSVLALLATALATDANAIPITFDFTGTLNRHTLYDGATGILTSDTSQLGQALSATLTVEMDRFPASGTVTDAFSFRSLFLPTDLGAPSPWSGSLSIGGQAVSLSLFDLNYAYLELQDSKGPLSCGPGCTTQALDSTVLVGRSDRSGPLGVTASTVLAFNAHQSFDPAIPDPSYIDLDQPFSIGDLATIALPNLQFNYGTSTFDCQALNLCFLASADNYWFDVTVTRTLGATAVPEPGVLGLFALALLLLVLSTRRRANA